MPQLPGQIIAERAAILRARAQRALDRFLAAEIGKTRSVLAEKGGRGRTEHYAPVKFARSVPRGEIVSARLTGVDSRSLLAQVVT